MSSTRGHRRARGDVILVRYADDFVLGFQNRDEAERFLKWLQKRRAEYGLELHPEKTRLIEFGRPGETGNVMERGSWRRSISGFYAYLRHDPEERQVTVKRKTVGKSMTAKLRDVAAELRRRRNDPIAQTGNWPTQVVRGYFNYHAARRET